MSSVVLRGAVSLIAVALALSACEDTMSPAEAPPLSAASMPLAPPPQVAKATEPSSAVVDADAGAIVDESRHAVLVTACLIDKRGCLLAQPSPAPDDSSYRVVFGGGTGAIRTRGQAMAELYKEIRDRTEAGAHLSAEPHHIGEPAPGADDAKAAPRSRPGAPDDPLVEAAFQLMDAVDRDGELTIDSLPMRSPSSCKLSLASLEADGGTSRCLVNAPASTTSSRLQRGR